MRTVGTSLIVLIACNLIAGSYIPEPWQTALMARYIIHNVDWVAVSTVSTIQAVKTYPFVNIKSMSDGPKENGTGMPYFLMNDMDLSGIDVLADNRVSILATLAEVEYCKSKNYDPQDPRCGRLIITGKMIKVNENDPDYPFAKQALFSRHAPMSDWMKVHKFYIAKLNIEQIVVLDFFGGAKYVKIDDYFNANLPKPVTYHMQDINVIIINA